MTDEKKGTRTQSGHYYGRDWRGRLHDLGTAADRAPDEIICRRLLDFPGAAVPAGGAVGACARCGAAIVFNPAKYPEIEHICMQCARIQPDPLTPGGRST